MTLVPDPAEQPKGGGGMLLGSPGREGKAPQKVISANKGILSQSKAACWMTSHGTGAAITEDLIPCVHLCLLLLHTGVHHYKALMILTEHMNGLNCLSHESETLKLLSSLPSMPWSRISFFKIQRHSLRFIFHLDARNSYFPIQVTRINVWMINGCYCCFLIEEVFLTEEKRTAAWHLIFQDT